MSRRMFDRKRASLLWALLECVFFSGVVLGWSWLSLIFRSDFFLISGCNVTIPPSPTEAPEPASAVFHILQVTVRQPCGGVKQRDLRDREDQSEVKGVSKDITRADVTKQSTLDEDERHRPYLSGVHSPSLAKQLSNLSWATVPTVTEPSVLVENHAAVEVSRPKMPLCTEQRERLRLLFALAIVLKDLILLPFGAFYDKYGTTRTRLLTVLTFAVGNLMMTFTTRDVPWLILPALTLTGVAGVGVLLTNVQVANLFGRRRHLVLALFCGASLSSGFITYMMQLAHERGVDVQTSFMFLTIGLVPMLVSTVAFLPKTRVPWPLPPNYGQRRSHSLDENTLQAGLGGVEKLRKPSPRFWPMGGKQLFVGAMVWHGVHSLHTAQVETLLVDVGHWRDFTSSDLEHAFGWLQLLSVFLVFIPGLLIDKRRRRDSSYLLGTQQMQRIVPAILLTSLLAALERGVLLAGHWAAGGLILAFALHALHRVCLLTTTLAFLLHVHFSQEHLGKYVSLTLATSSAISALQFPIRLYLHQRPLLVSCLLLTLLLLTPVHAFNVWNCCRRGLIRDHPERSLDEIFPPSLHAAAPSSCLGDRATLLPEGPHDPEPGPSCGRNVSSTGGETRRGARPPTVASGVSQEEQPLQPSTSGSHRRLQPGLVFSVDCGVNVEETVDHAHAGGEEWEESGDICWAEGPEETAQRPLPLLLTEAESPKQGRGHSSLLINTDTKTSVNKVVEGKSEPLSTPPLTTAASAAETITTKTANINNQQHKFIDRGKGQIALSIKNEISSAAGETLEAGPTPTGRIQCSANVLNQDLSAE